MPHICTSESGQHWTNDGILLIGPLGKHFSEILIEFNTFSLMKMHLKLSSIKWWQFCLSLIVLRANLSCWCGCHAAYICKMPRWASAYAQEMPVQPKIGVQSPDVIHHKTRAYITQPDLISHQSLSRYRDSYYKDKTVSWQFYTYNGKSYTGKTASLYGSGHETVAVLLPGFAINW